MVAPTLEWLVVGGGPTGTMAVAALLQQSFDGVGWVERGSFDSMGRLSEYGSVPANTRNDRLVEAFRSLEAFDFERSQQLRSDALLRRPSLETAPLRLSAEALRDASASVRRKVSLWRADYDVTKLSCDGDVWTVDDDTQHGHSLTARRVILATGAEPRRPDDALSERLRAAGVDVIDHDDAVVPGRLLTEGAVHTLAVVGGSHSGMLAAQNFLSFQEERCAEDSFDDDDDAEAAEAAAVATPKKTKRRVFVFDRKDQPRFAEERDGWIKYDGTGLKGSVAEWTKQVLAKSSKSLTYERIDDDADLAETLVARGVDAVVFTVGFERNTRGLDVTFRGDPVDVASPRAHHPRTGRLAPGLHGVGIAYPEYWTDQDDFTEPRVGFVCHYLRHLDRVFDAALEDVPL